MSWRAGRAGGSRGVRCTSSWRLRSGGWRGRFRRWRWVSPWLRETAPSGLSPSWSRSASTASSRSSAIERSSGPGPAGRRGLGRIAREAAMQSRRLYLPEVSEPLPLQVAADKLSVVGGVALAEPGGDPVSLDRPVVLVGPEGGWSPAEAVLATPPSGPRGDGASHRDCGDCGRRPARRNAPIVRSSSSRAASALSRRIWLSMPETCRTPPPARGSHSEWYSGMATAGELETLRRWRVDGCDCCCCCGRLEGPTSFGHAVGARPAY